ncbi:MAG: DUF4190 domain-containing protein [Planctomycetes bacterium]|nr:DUF4190 domain-containing protein [Planctomycetota bacterium]
MGRARTRQIPGQPQAPAAYQQQPNGYPPPPQGGGAYQQPQGYPQPPQGYGQAPQGYPPPGGQPQPAGAPGQPYQMQGPQMGKPTSVLAIVSLVTLAVGMVIGLVSLGFFSIPLFLIGAVLGYLGMRETAAWGKKSGRGMALGGTIANLVCMVLNGGFLLLALLFVQSAGSALEQQANAAADAMLIRQRLQMYKDAKGDLKPGGPQFKAGFRNDTAALGPMLTVPDLVSEGEMQNPLEQYSIEVVDETATIFWTPKDGVRQEVGTFRSGFSGWEDDDFGFDDTPRRR